MRLYVSYTDSPLRTKKEEFLMNLNIDNTSKISVKAYVSNNKIKELHIGGNV